MEAAGQLIRLFRDGLDYAFILKTACAVPRSGACYPVARVRVPNPSAGSSLVDFSRSMSLYRADLRLALFPPLGVATSLSRGKVSPM